MRLKDQVAVVTGAASGIGRAVCLALAGQGARLGLVDLQEDGLKSLAVELDQRGARGVPAPADVTDRQAVRSAVDSVAAQLGPVDLLVASAGITGMTRVSDLDVPLTERLVRVNLLGVANAIDAVLAGMLARGRGHIVGVSSLAGCRGMPHSAGYCASKAGLSNYLESLRPELARKGIAVTTVLPGAVRTPLWQNTRVLPPGEMLAPEEAAGYILRAILRRRRLCAFPWKAAALIRVTGWLPPAWYDWVIDQVTPHVAAGVED
jgi:short-subunit dehydrogenase